MAALALVLSCEHGGNRVPSAWANRFRGAEAVLASHRGWDPGALDLARYLARRLAAPLVSTTVTRLLVEPNRSLTHPALFSEFTRALPEGDRGRLVELYWRPHRRLVERVIREAMAEGSSVLHVGVHSFTPVLDGKERGVDVGLLYDPARELERQICRAWGRKLRQGRPNLRVRANAPYRGVSDGLTTQLRSVLPDGYAGVELEVSQGLLLAGGRGRAALHRAIAEALAGVLSPPSR